MKRQSDPFGVVSASMSSRVFPLSFAVLAALLMVPRVQAGPPEPASSEFWSFAPPKWSEVPAEVGASPAAETAHWIDAFLEKALQAHGLSASERAPDEAYFRRLTTLMTGLPPRPEDRDRFMEAEDPNKRQRWTDRWLASYAFGERMASFWLPIARYAEDQAHMVGNNASLNYPNAHLYRQWVIDAFNRDLPYPQFIEAQLAADLMEGGDRERDGLGFLGLGPKYYNRGRLEVKADEWEDRVDTVTRSFLGLTVACARCHDHKYDPISTEDYHALAGVFASTEMFNEPLPGVEMSEEEKKKKGSAPLDMRHIVKEGKPQDLPVFVRGDVNRKGDVVPRRFLPVLTSGEPRLLNEGSGRGQLASAITHPDNPLTARVMVNRLWREVFGKGIVATTSNFGVLGQPPTHPALLDNLAMDFARHGSVKRLMRALMESAAFQRSSLASSEVMERDPANQWLGRFDRRRLSFEMWRDALLTVSGTLDPRGGRSQEIEDESNHRRTVYAKISRLDLNDVLEQFDYPDPNLHAAARVETTTTSQKLYQLNHPFVWDQAASMAERASEAAADPEGRIEWLYRQLLGREPRSRDLDLGVAFLQEGEHRLTALAHVLISSNEMLYLD